MTYYSGGVADGFLNIAITVKGTYVTERRFSYYLTGANVGKLDYLEERVMNGLALVRWDRNKKSYAAPYADVVVEGISAWTIS